MQFAPMRRTAPRPNRPASKAGFQFFGASPQGAFQPGTPEFLFWQCREAALISINVWEQLHASLASWSVEAVNPKKLKLVQDGGDDLNAFYDREHLAFFHHKTGTLTTFSGASTDVVAHEAGHAFLDLLRPELFVSNLTEQGAFHEAFGDCIAILVALFDSKIRTALLGVTPDLGAANFVEGTAEDLSDAVRLELGAGHPAAGCLRASGRISTRPPSARRPARRCRALPRQRSGVCRRAGRTRALSWSCFSRNPLRPLTYLPRRERQPPAPRVTRVKGVPPAPR